MCFRCQIIRGERRRLEPLDVPEVKIFVAGQPQKGSVAVTNFLVAALRKIVASAHEAGRPTVFESAIAFSGRIQKEQVTIKIVGNTQ